MCKRVILSLGFLLLCSPSNHAQKLINVDFGAHTNPAFSIKTGKAAVGITVQDYWNLYSRDGAYGEYLSSAEIMNLKLSDGTVTEADMTASGAPGAWYTFSNDAMLQSYLYPGNPNINISFSNLQAGHFDVYVYAHGQPASENSVVQLFAGPAVVGEKSTSSGSDWDSHGWVEGNQFVVFRNVSVVSNQVLSIIVKPGVAGMAVINGIQLVEIPPDLPNPTIVIEQQPQTVSVPFGGIAEFSVLAQSQLPVTYQWFYNGNIISNATASTLQITNVGAVSAGRYHVAVQNDQRTAVSDEAFLLVHTEISDPLINIDFGAHLNEALQTKTGPAAIGKASSDQWNLYSRDSNQGSWLDNNSLENLVWSDGTPTSARIDVSNAAGAWYTIHPDAMFESYLYPLSRVGNINAVLTGLPSGAYDVYVYAHGQIPSENAVIQLSTDRSNYGLKVSSPAADWNAPAWVEGSHYLLFRNVQLSSGERLHVSSQPGQSGLAVMNGLQLRQISTNSPPSIEILFQPSDVITTNGAVADFSVHATNGTFLTYQWYFNGAPLPSGTNQLLRIENVSSNNAGAYRVEISGGGATAISEPAYLQLYTPVVTPLLNIDYGAHLNPVFSHKTGPAAVGQGLQDQWNLYSRDGSNGAFLSSNRLADLVWSDGSPSSISLNVNNAAGAWFTLNPDPMFESYLYPISRQGNINSVLSGLPVGVYDIYVYAHGQIPSENGVIEVFTSAGSAGTKSTTDSSNWDLPLWTNGRHYVHFRNVSVMDGLVRIVSKPGTSGLSVINGVQIVKQEAASGNGISITSHPSSAILPVGQAVELQVSAQSGLPLEYQWFRNNTLLPGATSPVLRLEDLQYAHAGIYHVVISNSQSSVTSASARLDVYTAVDGHLLNIDFGAHLNPAFITNKVGPAAYGKSLDDSWNLYSRDDAHGGWRATGELSNLLWADGATSAIRLEVSNAAGAWYTYHPDPMFQSYLYPLSHQANIGLRISNLPSGKYDLIAYSHGQIRSENGNIHVATDSASYGYKTNSAAADWDPGYWVEGGQFVRFSDILILPGQSLQVTASPGVSPLAVINGLQLVLKDGVPTEFNHIVADWTFEDGAPGAIAASTLDSATNQLHLANSSFGTATFTPTDASTAGAISVMLPPGNNGTGNALRAPDSMHFNLGTQFTIEASVNPGSQNATWNRGVVVGQDAITGRLVYGLDYRSETRSLNFLIVDAHGQGENVTAIIPDDGISHHVAGVYNSGTLQIYLDKVLVASKSTALIPGLTPGGAGRVTLGANDIGGYWFHGILDRVRISREALAPAQFFPHRRDPGTPVTILQPLQNITVEEGATASFEVIATGPGALTYQWFFNGAPIPNQISNILVVPNVQASNAGAYKVTVTSGIWEASSTGTLTVVPAVLTAPAILHHPVSRIASIGGTATFSVTAAGSPPLAYQWQFNNAPIEGATASTLVLSNLTLGNAGFYSVAVSNGIGATNSAAALLTILPADDIPPTVTITSPVSGSTTTNRVTLAGSVIDNQALSHVEWLRNGQPVGPIALTNNAFIIPDLLLNTGTNIFTVRAFDLAGNAAEASVAVALEVVRSIAIGASTPVQEGARITLPILVSSSGEIGAISFSVQYDTNYLAEPELNWQIHQHNPFTQVNAQTPGVIHATYVLPGSTFQAGADRSLAILQFRARSVPENLSTPVTLQLQGIYSAAGDPITSGTTVHSGAAEITRRNYIGDNNANDRLDVGDAHAIIRMLTLLDPTRAWDVTGNDLNSNASLDAGDIVRVLRAIVHIDPQPSAGIVHGDLLGSKALRAAAVTAQASLSADVTRLQAGQQVRVQVSLANLSAQLSGASFRLDYPTNALRLESAAAHSAGPIIPQNAIALWNLSPDQDYTLQDGTIHFAATSADSWSSNSGALAELTFTVLEGAAAQYAWRLELQAEAASSIDIIPLAASQLILTGRDALPAELNGVAFNSSTGAFELRLIGETGVRYRVESSTDLVEWTEVQTVSDTSGPILVTDPVGDEGQKFYRAIQLD